jgi:hypothetical protein
VQTKAKKQKIQRSMYYRNGTAILWIAKTKYGIDNYIGEDFSINKSILSSVKTEEVFPIIDRTQIINKTQRTLKYRRDKSSGF